jgi:hypothetical protein
MCVMAKVSFTHVASDGSIEELLEDVGMSAVGEVSVSGRMFHFGAFRFSLVRTSAQTAGELVVWEDYLDSIWVDVKMGSNAGSLSEEERSREWIIEVSTVPVQAITPALETQLIESIKLFDECVCYPAWHSQLTGARTVFRRMPYRALW